MELRNLLLLSLLIATSGCFRVNRRVEPSRPMPVEEARKILRETIEKDQGYLDEKGEYYRCCAPTSEIRIRTHEASYVKTYPGGKPKTVRLSFEEPHDTYDYFSTAFVVTCGPFARLGGYRGDMPRGYLTKDGFHARNREGVERIVNAYSALVAFNREHGEEEFTKLAKQWRAAPVRNLSEEGEKHRVLAENSFREKDLEKARQHFEDALDTDPTWPDGNFNLALLYGETGEFARAAKYMKRYLLLVPDSRDAKASKEKIIIWEDKASRAKK